MTTHALGTLPTHRTRVTGWQHWAPDAAIAWSLLYAALSLYWAITGNGFPFAPTPTPDPLASVLARLGPAVAWVIVVLAGLPAAALGVAMKRNIKAGSLRTLFVASGGVLSAVLLLFMADLPLLETLGYVPFTLFRLVTGGDTSFFVRAALQSNVAHQLYC